VYWRNGRGSELLDSPPKSPTPIRRLFCRVSAKNQKIIDSPKKFFLTFWGNCVKLLADRVFLLKIQFYFYQYYIAAKTLTGILSWRLFVSSDFSSRDSKTVLTKRFRGEMISCLYSRVFPGTRGYK
jgi:hypothetical protein